MKLDKRVKRVTIRFSKEEYTKYLSMFEKVNSSYTQSEFIRDCIFSTVPLDFLAKKSTHIKPSECDKERIRQIAGLTSNINQIARSLNILMKSTNQSTLLSYLQKLDNIYTYCEAAMYEKVK